MSFCMQDQIFTFETLLRRMQLDDGERPFVIWREKDLFGAHAYPVKIDVPCLFLCWNGEMEIEINLQTYHLDKELLLCYTVPCACRIVKRSPGFLCVAWYIGGPIFSALDCLFPYPFGGNYSLQKEHFAHLPRAMLSSSLRKRNEIGLLVFMNCFAFVPILPNMIR